MAAADFYDTVQKIYIAYYQRPADPLGLRFWSDQLDAAGGDFSQIIDSFGTSPEANQLYGAITVQNIGEVIDAIYNGLFGRDADPGGKAFYTEGFLTGTFTAASIALDILNGAQGSDAQAIENKLVVANDFTEVVDGRSFEDADFGTGGISQLAVSYSGPADVESARNFLAAVTTDPDSLVSRTDTTIFVFREIADNPGARVVLTLQEATVTEPGVTITEIPGETSDPVFMVTTLDPIITTASYWISSENGEGLPLEDFRDILLNILGGQITDTVANIDTIINVFNNSLGQIANITLNGAGDLVQGGDGGSDGGDGGDGGSGTGGEASSGDGGVGGDTGTAPAGAGGDGGDATGGAGDGAAGGAGGAAGNEAAEGKEGDFTGNYEMTISLTDVTAYSAVLELSASQFEFLNNLLFDADGNIRFEEREVEVFSYMPLLARNPETGELILDDSNTPDE